MLCIHRIESLGSTNDEAVTMAKDGAPPNTVVWAEAQTAGRGRMGRTWTSAPGNVSFSIILRPALSPALVGRLSVACGLAVAEALRNETWLPVRTKWPNDLYLYGGKLGGILVETGTGWAVVGVGINVVSHPDIPPPGTPATSLAAHGPAGSVEALVPPLGQAVVSACEQVRTEEGWAALCSKWARLDLAFGPLTVIEDGATFEAEGTGLEPDGALRVKYGDSYRVITAGEASVRK